MVRRSKVLDREFFRQSPRDCARELIGCRFEWRSCAGVVVETEAYAALDDPACHTAFRPSARRFVEENEPGTAYVYLNYGVHWLFNLLVKGDGGAGFVLFRALEPVAGLGHMRARRKRKKSQELCSGPGKLTRALAIDGSVHGQDFLTLGHGRILAGERAETVWACPRIGISKGRNRLWRYVDQGSSHLSAPPVNAQIA